MTHRCKVFIGKLPRNVGRRDLERWLEDNNFKSFDGIHVKEGYAFVEFRDSRDADDCVKDMDRRDFLGSRVTVELARGPRNNSRFENEDRRRREYTKERYSYRNGYYRDKYGAPYNTEWKLSVQNVSSRVGWQELKDFFRQAGEVTYCECHRHRNGEGVVEFATRDDLRRAINKLNGKELLGKRIKHNTSSSYKSVKKDRASPSSPDNGSRHRRSRSESVSRGRSRSTSFA